MNNITIVFSSYEFQILEYFIWFYIWNNEIVRQSNKVSIGLTFEIGNLESINKRLEMQPIEIKNIESSKHSMNESNSKSAGVYIKAEWAINYIFIYLFFKFQFLLDPSNF